jgi:hypothetical protein
MTDPDRLRERVGRIMALIAGAAAGVALSLGWACPLFCCR